MCRTGLFRLVLVSVIWLMSEMLMAQGIRRSVICSSGASSATATGYRLRSTAAQPPNAGTVSNASNYLRQGFQQPSTCTSAPQALFDITAQAPDSCGGAYAFTYLDAARSNTEVFWSFGEGAQPLTSGELSPGLVNYLTPGLKTVVLSVVTDQCRSTDSLVFNVPSVPMVVTANVSDLWCYEEADGGISLFVAGGRAPYSVAWTHGDTSLDAGGLSAGLYGYTVTDVFGCMESGEATVVSPDSLSAGLMVRDESCQGALDGQLVAEVSGGTPPYRYSWSHGATDAVVQNLAKGSYRLTVTDSHDCERYLDADVGRSCDGLVFYDVISPNGDGSNDVWYIEGIDRFPQNRLRIYDRWGLLVYATDGYINTWEGRRSDGRELPLGVYYYTLELGDTLPGILKGSVTIIR
jgi:gliding motility-associated-like protein